jgi:hypothetical protein
MKIAEMIYLKLKITTLLQLYLHLCCPPVDESRYSMYTDSPLMVA